MSIMLKHKCSKHVTLHCKNYLFVHLVELQFLEPINVTIVFSSKDHDFS